MSIIEGETGLIVVDPLMYTETAQAAMDLYFQHRPRKPVVAVVYSHSHVDHFGGVRGVVRQEEVDAGRVQVIAPAGFMAEAVGENVIAGHAMGRRALYQFGMLLPRDARDRKSTRLNSSHQIISYAVFCLKKKKRTTEPPPYTPHRSTSALLLRL